MAGKGCGINLFASVIEAMEQGDYTSRQIADRTGIEASWVRSALNQLAKTGLVKRGPRLRTRKRGQPPIRWERA